MYRIECQHGILNIGVAGIARYGDVGALFAVDLDRQRQRLLDQELGFDFRPRGLRDQRVVAQQRPAFLGKMRHHRMK